MSTAFRRARSGLYVPRSGGGPGAGASAVFVSSTSDVTTSVIKPVGATIGDHLVVAIVTDTGALPALTGFNLLTLRNRFEGSNGSGTFAVLYRQIDGSESSSFSFSASSQVWAAALYRGGGGPPSLLGSVRPAAAVTLLPSRIRPPIDGVTLHIFEAGVNGGSTSISTPSGVTSREHVDGAYFSVNMCEETLNEGDDETRSASIPAGISISVALHFPDTTPIPYLVGYVGNNNNSSNATVTVPSTAEVGDLIVCAYEITANSLFAGPSGFNAIDGPGGASGGSYPLGYWWGYKICASGDIGAAIAVSSGSQVWGAACIVIRNPASTPIQSMGSMGSGSGSVITLATKTAVADAIAIHCVLQSTNGNWADYPVDSSTDPGLDWQIAQSGASGYGGVHLGLEGVPAGETSIGTTMATHPSSTWISNVALLNVA